MSSKPIENVPTDASEEMTEDELAAAAGGNPIQGAIGALSGVVGLGGVAEKTKEIIEEGSDMVAGAVNNLAGSQIMSKRKGR